MRRLTERIRYYNTHDWSFNWSEKPTASVWEWLVLIKLFLYRPLCWILILHVSSEKPTQEINQKEGGGGQTHSATIHDYYSGGLEGCQPTSYNCYPVQSLPLPQWWCAALLCMMADTDIIGFSFLNMVPPNAWRGWWRWWCSLHSRSRRKLHDGYPAPEPPSPPPPQSPDDATFFAVIEGDGGGGAGGGGIVGGGTHAKITIMYYY